MNRKRVGILLFNDVEVLDFCGPFEVFSVARMDVEHRRQESSPFEVLLVAETRDSITTSGGMKVLPMVSFAGCPPLDILVVPGGMGTRKEMLNAEVLRFVKEQAAKVELVASVCTGALILGKAGLLSGGRATTHWRAIEQLRLIHHAEDDHHRAWCRAGGGWTRHLQPGAPRHGVGLEGGHGEQASEQGTPDRNRGVLA